MKADEIERLIRARLTKEQILALYQAEPRRIEDVTKDGMIRAVLRQWEKRRNDSRRRER